MPDCQIIANSQKIFMLGKPNELLALVDCVVAKLAQMAGRSPQFIFERLLEHEKESLGRHADCVNIINIQLKKEEREARRLGLSNT